MLIYLDFSDSVIIAESKWKLRGESLLSVSCLNYVDYNIEQKEFAQNFET